MHAVLAKQGARLAVSDLLGLGDGELLAAAPLDAPFLARVQACCRLVDTVDFKVDLGAGRLAAHLGNAAIQVVPGVGPALAAVFVAGHQPGSVTERRGHDVATSRSPAACSPSSTTASATATSAPSTAPTRREHART